MGDQKQKKDEQEETTSPGLDYEIPDTQGIVGELDSAFKEELKREHQEETEEDEKKEKAGKPVKRKQKRGGTICCCGAPMCRIGPFVQTEGKDEE